MSVQDYSLLCPVDMSVFSHFLWLLLYSVSQMIWFDWMWFDIPKIYWMNINSRSGMASPYVCRSWIRDMKAACSLYSRCKRRRIVLETRCTYNSWTWLPRRRPTYIQPGDAGLRMTSSPVGTVERSHRNTTR